MKTVIYLDVLLLVNFLAAYFLLLGAGLLSGQRAGFVRLLLGSGAAALSSLVLFAPEQAYPVQILYKIFTALIITAITFGWHNKRRLITEACWYAALNIALAGLVMLIILQTGTKILQTGNLAVYLRVSPLLLVILSGLCCAAVEIGSRCFTKHKPVLETVGLEMELGGLLIRLRGVLDTGCHLTDPITCLPVLVVSFPDAKDRLPQPVREFLRAWFAGDAPGEPPPGTRLRLIPCNTASSHSLLPGFAVNGIGMITPHGVLGLGRSAVAFAPQSFGSDRYEALYGNDFL
ncbi:sigma-E processing peptidase SpoIIGA [Subdoligranulum variabile]|uniref:Sigma-E processing peptidase SpoIIGA n=1 Tax=Subdoligranulum variabile DSM 15176 TaxID=411471 RepID=D1PKM6_9FIRM|nr:sigma-E processing peptidase SpoIIGA [Subdoligranulum variabile]EFB76534.1 putative sigma-E processing peptidase SpoIIGA [Subdoligranulum variabile DSM 15176]UWP68228.1 sigma-E processing peptidase SpoIIGA [Subdoligranulum variabile]